LGVKNRQDSLELGNSHNFGRVPKSSGRKLFISFLIIALKLYFLMPASRRFDLNAKEIEEAYLNRFRGGILSIVVDVMEVRHVCSQFTDNDYG